MSELFSRNQAFVKDAETIAPVRPRDLSQYFADRAAVGFREILQRAPGYERSPSGQTVELEETVEAETPDQQGADPGRPAPAQPRTREQGAVPETRHQAGAIDIVAGGVIETGEPAGAGPGAGEPHGTHVTGTQADDRAAFSTNPRTEAMRRRFLKMNDAADSAAYLAGSGAESSESRYIQQQQFLFNLSQEAAYWSQQAEYWSDQYDQAMLQMEQAQAEYDDALRQQEEAQRMAGIIDGEIANSACGVQGSCAPQEQMLSETERIAESLGLDPKTQAVVFENVDGEIKVKIRNIQSYSSSEELPELSQEQLDQLKNTYGEDVTQYLTSLEDYNKARADIAEARALEEMKQATDNQAAAAQAGTDAAAGKLGAAAAKVETTAANAAQAGSKREQAMTQMASTVGLQPGQVVLKNDKGELVAYDKNTKTATPLTEEQRNKIPDDARIASVGGYERWQRMKERLPAFQTGGNETAQATRQERGYRPGRVTSEYTRDPDPNRPSNVGEYNQVASGAVPASQQPLPTQVATFDNKQQQPTVPVV